MRAIYDHSAETRRGCLTIFVAQNIPGTESLLMENAGHTVTLERTQEVGEAMARFSDCAFS